MVIEDSVDNNPSDITAVAVTDSAWECDTAQIVTAENYFSK